MEDLKKIVAKNIAALRVNAHLTQFELGEKLSYSDKAVSRWERGEAVPDAYVLLMMSDIFGVTVDYILKEHAEEEAPPATLPPETKKGSANKRRVTLLAFLSVWALALLVFVITAIVGNAFWLVFIYAIPISATVMLVLNCLWGTRGLSVLYVSALAWGILLSVHLSLLSRNLWMLYLIGIPAQVIIPIAFSFKRSASSGEGTALKKASDKLDKGKEPSGEKNAPTEGVPDTKKNETSE